MNDCPICGGDLSAFGRRLRKVIDSGGATLRLIIRRLRCGGCGKIHHELPDMVVPYKRYCAETVEAIITGETAAIVCEEGTIRRIRAWWMACRLYFESVIASLQEKYEIAFSSNMAPSEIFRAVTNAHLWPSTQSVFLSG